MKTNKAPVKTKVDFWKKGKPTGNFGDTLSLLYLERMFLPVSRFAFGTVYLVGSVIEDKRIIKASLTGYAPGDRRGQAIFWGCGKQSAKPLNPKVVNRALFLGVRGVRTRDALGLPATTPLGDTAFLLPRFYQPKPDPATTGKVLWVPHTDHDDPRAADLAGCPDHVVMRPEIPNTAAGCTAFIDAITSASFVMANAMHSAVIAMAYGVPFCFWGGREVNMPFKWGDLTSPFGFAMEFQATYAAARAEYDRVRPDRAYAAFDLDPLLAVAPYKVRK